MASIVELLAGRGTEAGARAQHDAPPFLTRHQQSARVSAGGDTGAGAEMFGLVGCQPLVFSRHAPRHDEQDQDEEDTSTATHVWCYRPNPTNPRTLRTHEPHEPFGSLPYIDRTRSRSDPHQVAAAPYRALDVIPSNPALHGDGLRRVDRPRSRAGFE